MDRNLMMIAPALSAAVSGSAVPVTVKPGASSNSQKFNIAIGN